jgi:hypothetical protein|tara:strand:- start:139 stop:282 length:144 start_codon:yes stop_codon:yes gene_type:complete
MGIKLANISNAATAARRLIKSKTGKNFDINKYNKKKAKLLKEWKGWF